MLPANPMDCMLVAAVAVVVEAEEVAHRLAAVEQHTACKLDFVGEPVDAEE